MVGPAILLLCTSIATSDKPTQLACRKAFEAGVVHTGHDKKIKNYAKAREREVKEYVSEEAGIGMMVIYTAFIRKEADFQVYKFAGTQSTVIRIKPEGIDITLNWRF